MMPKTKILQSLLLLLFVASLTNCTGVPCNELGTHGANQAPAVNPCPNSGGGGGGGGGGGNGCSSTLTPTQVMLSLDSTGKVLEYGIDSTTGNLTLMCNTATAVLGEVAVSNNTFLYVLDEANSKIYGFKIAHGKSGALTPIANQPFTVPEPLSIFAHIVPDPLGRFIFVTNFDGNDVHVFLINQATGALSEALNSPFPVSSPENIAVNSAGTFAFVTDPVDGDIFIMSLDSAGQLAQAPTSPLIIIPVADTPGFPLTHPNGNILFTANFKSVSAFTFNIGTQDLTEVGGSPYSTVVQQIEPVLVALDGTAKYLYVMPAGNQGDIGFQNQQIIGYKVDIVGGTLVTASLSPFAATAVFDLVGNPLGPQLYVQSGNKVLVYTIDPATGNLTAPSGTSTITAQSNLVIANIQ